MLAACSNDGGGLPDRDTASTEPVPHDGGSVTPPDDDQPPDEDPDDGAMTDAGGPPAADAGGSAGCDELPDPPGDNVVDLGAEGLSEGDLIDPYLDEFVRDGNEVHIPAGRYRWQGAGDGTLDEVSIIGDGEVIFDAGDRYEFGTTWRTNTRFEMRNITVRGKAAPNRDKYRFEASTPEAVIVVRNFRLPDGSYPGGDGRVGIRVNDTHRGTVYLYDLYVVGFADNGLYASPPGKAGAGDGPVHVIGGFFSNNNISGVRLGSTGSSVRGTVIVNVDPVGGNHRAVRIREPGRNIVIEDVDIVQAIAGTAIEIHRGSEGGSGTMRNVRIRNDISQYAIRVDGGDWSGSGVDISGSGNLDIDGPADLEDVCTGDACDAPRTEPRECYRPSP